MSRRADDRPPPGQRLRESGLALVMLAPSLALFGVFVFWPLIRTVWLGLHTTSPFDFSGSSRTWVGWKQYGDVLSDPNFRHSVWVTVAFTLLTVPLGLALGVGLAMLADKPIRGVAVFRTLFSSTVATSVAVASLMWLVLLNPSIGVLTKLLPFDALKTPGLLGRPSWALFAVSLTTVWQNLGFTFIVLTAGLQGIPEELLESALVDGARGWRRFTNVSLPLLGPTLLFVTVVLTIGAFQSFGQIDILTGGGPGTSTRVLVYSIFDNGFGSAVNEGVAAVQSVFLFLMLFGLSFLQFRFLDKRVHYGD